MTAAAELYAVAAGIDRQVATVEHTPEHARCWRCHIEAKARLYVRAAGCAEAVGA